MELKDIAGVGEKTLLGLNKLGIENVFDLITYNPRKYFVLKRSDINLVSEGELVIIDRIVISVPVCLVLMERYVNLFFDYREVIRYIM